MSTALIRASAKVLSTKTKQRIAENKARRTRRRNKQWRDWDKGLILFNANMRRYFRRVVPTLVAFEDLGIQPLFDPGRERQRDDERALELMRIFADAEPIAYQGKLADSAEF